MKIPGMKKSKKKLQCQQDQNTKQVSCRSYRQFEDGTQVEVAGADFQFDAMCNAVPTNVFENEEGELGKLHDKAVGLLKGKCKGSLPSDY